MKQRGNGPQNFGVVSVSFKEGEKLARFLIYFSFGKIQRGCIV
jgi:hypothetical protein